MKKEETVKVKNILQRSFPVHGKLLHIGEERTVVKDQEVLNLIRECYLEMVLE